MNQPDRYSNVLFGKDAQKCEFKADTRLRNATTFTFLSEDHTMGNLIRMKLHEDPKVVFAGYRIPHPLEPKMVVRVQTTDDYPADTAIMAALDTLGKEFHTFSNEFDQQRRNFLKRN